MKIKTKFKPGQIVSTTGGRLLKIKNAVNIGIIHSGSGNIETNIEYSCYSVLDNHPQEVKAFEYDLIGVKSMLKRLKELK